MSSRSACGGTGKNVSLSKAELRSYVTIKQSKSNADILMKDLS